MNVRFAVLFSLLVTLCLGPAAVAIADGTTVVFVNSGRVLEQAPQALAARKKLEHEFAPRDDKLSGDQRKLKSLEDKLNREGAIMSEDQRRKLEREVLTKQRDLKRAREAFTEDLNLRRNEEFSKLQHIVSDAISALAKENNYDIVLESGVVFSSDKVDITSQVIKRLQQEYVDDKKGGKN